MEVILAKSAGMCAGVLRALKTVYTKLSEERLYTYGSLIHNKNVINYLQSRGVNIIENLDEEINGTVVLRSHGVPPEVYCKLKEKNISYIDCTCIDVKKIHNIVTQNKNEGRIIIIAGNINHPEIIGIMGFAGDNTIVIENEQDIYNLNLNPKNKYAMVVQTTFMKEKYDKISVLVKKTGIDIKIYDTICRATIDRQMEAEELSKNVDHMIIIGDRLSSNTAKLYEICKKNCQTSFIVETINELELNIFSANDKIGITAGASTPPDIIKEAFIAMSEIESNKNNQSFEEMLNESFVTLHTGNVVKGTVINVSNNEVFVNLGYKSDGIIPRGEFSEDPTINPADSLAPGDEIEVFVVRVNDGDGNVLLSKKKIDSQRNYDELESAHNNNLTLRGKIIEVVKGGLIALISGIRVFVPSSQISNRYIEDLSQFKGKEFNFNIIEFDKSKRRFVAGRKTLAAQEQKENKEKVFVDLEIGKQIEGTVSRIVDFGAFVDLGGVDGLIHISELSWGRIKKVKDVLNEGDKVTVTVLELDKEKGKISLSLKDISSDPWMTVSEKYPVGAIVKGKVVRMVTFGAFVELESGVDGLIHISQIASKHVVKPEDVLQIGEVVEVKVTDIDLETKRISLSKKEADMLIAQAEAAIEANSAKSESKEETEKTEEAKVSE